jgi:hypothetical protein
MMQRFTRESKQLWSALVALDRQTVVVLTMASVLGMWKYTFGSRAFFNRELGSSFGVADDGLWGWFYLFGTQGLIGFMLPAAVLLLAFQRKPSEIGLGLGDWKLGLALLGLYVPLVAAGCWVLSAQESFQQKYPLNRDVSSDWGLFLAYELLFVFYWFGWEYLWRGFTLFGTAHTFGHWAIFIQMLPFAALHAQKPTAEAYLSILGGLVLGTVVWRCRSFWIAVPFHALQMLAIDLCCTLRLRSEVEGIGPGALIEAIRAL